VGHLSRHKKELPKARAAYEAVGEVECPYFKSKIIFNARGFHHLQFSSGSERSKQAQLNKFRLFPYAVEIIKNSGTLQQYREQLGAVGRKIGKSGHRDTKVMKYWSFEGIVGSEENMLRVKTVVRQIGDGPRHFWSVMSDTGFSRKSNYKFSSDDVLDG
jgi:hypothetical protein